eukprot:scaffold9477_cov197-Amphora_coffeaeformis.AAC.7
MVSTSKSWPSGNRILWSGIARDGVILCEAQGEPDPKIPQAGRKLITGSPKATWDYHTYTIVSQSQKYKRLVQTCKFSLYELVPLKVNARAKLRGLKSHTFLNGRAVRIVEYQAEKNKYLIRPTIPLEQKISNNGRLLVHADNIEAEQKVRVWTFACLFDGSIMDKESAALFVEKIMVLAETFRETEEWRDGEDLSAQSVFGPILEVQMEQFQYTATLETLDQSMEFSAKITEKNIVIEQDQAQHVKI